MTRARRTALRHGVFAVTVTALSASCAAPQTREVRALMQEPIVPASDAIFGAVIYANGQLAEAPASDADWDRLGQHAVALLEAAMRLRTLAPDGTDPSAWLQQSDALADASQAAVDAISTQSLEGVLDAGSRLYDSCTNCHAAYVPD